MSVLAKIALLLAVLASLSGPLLAAPIGDDPLTPVTPAVTPQSVVTPSAPQPWYFGVMLRRAMTPVGSGLRIDSLRSDGPAAQAGLSAGDVLLAAGQTDLQSVRSKVAALTILRGSVQAQPLPPGACPHTAVAKGQIVLTVYQARSGQVVEVLVQPTLEPQSTAIVASPRTPFNVQPTVVSTGRGVLSIPATFNPITGQRILPSGLAATQSVGFSGP